MLFFLTAKTLRRKKVSKATFILAPLRLNFKFSSNLRAFAPPWLSAFLYRDYYNFKSTFFPLFNSLHNRVEYFHVLHTLFTIDGITGFLPSKIIPAISSICTV